MKNTGVFKTIAAAGSFVVLAGMAQASTFTFDNIAGGDTYGDAYAGNFSLEVSDIGGGNVLLQFVSASVPGLDYFIRTIFVDDTNPTSFPSLPATSDAAYSVGTVSMTFGSGGNLPQGNNVGFSTDFNFDRDNNNSTGNDNAIHQGETAGFVFAGSFSGILAALNSGDLSFGIHLQGLPNGESDSYVISQVPVPAAGLMLFGALGGLGFAARRKRKAA